MRLSTRRTCFSSTLATLADSQKVVIAVIYISKALGKVMMREGNARLNVPELRRVPKVARKSEQNNPRHHHLCHPPKKKKKKTSKRRRFYNGLLSFALCYTTHTHGDVISSRRLTRGLKDVISSQHSHPTSTLIPRSARRGTHETKNKKFSFEK